ncbi:MAG: class I SAM-dependent methyltransferase [Verrucomicrobia bacterium]|nr:class I SAM-dependent methyltransferase [Verrucomicrobiota bacterium]
MKNETSCQMEYAKDEFGKEILLKDGKFQVMMEWEKPYMEACIDALQPFGDVLEIGFGCGYSATRIQSFKPKSHTIIEFHPMVAQKARAWAKQYPNVKIVEGTWQNALSSLGVFDAIFFDDYPLESEEQMNNLEKEKQQSHALLQKGNQLIQEVSETLPFLHEMVYADADLDELIDHVLKNKSLTVEHLCRFLKELRMGNQITAEQMSRVIQRLEKEGIALSEDSSFPAPAQQKFQFRGPNERLLTFLQQALNGHMRKGSRFSCFLSSSVSKYDDPKFVDAVICNPYLDYTEHTIEIDVPSNCDYYSESQALVIVITKME